MTGDIVQQYPEDVSLHHGDFSLLAAEYSRYREGYAPVVRDTILGLLGRPVNELDIVDVGAGTGIWTRMIAERSPRSITAVEPNQGMREAGIRDSTTLPIRWRAGTAEDTGVDSHSADLLTMASSFHWVDFNAGMREFHRVLRPGGWFVALWNPRDIEANPLLREIEGEITRLRPNLERISSGRSESIASLSSKLAGLDDFTNVVYFEGRHTVRQSVDHYLGLWRSTNDVQVQLGPDLFERFLGHVQDLLAGREWVDTTYLTRAWAAQTA
ncbi:class I SAM-dependent methyltransferase [Amycolatopsis pithecellobii]|uniref:Methyltransferase domain-containing protein n=1 Tax=Amycolatopsis pithecellobii TaxID=664692 RepID=A0A6N7YMS0_9PSEU|nr:class I SAM-dependent methyltransferase [Amycolatopsis pithecellobii]MTD54277.1 methyltransferase domain-containing protein [Amycolatopsis pithecellobii]